MNAKLLALIAFSAPGTLEAVGIEEGERLIDGIGEDVGVLSLHCTFLPFPPFPPLLPFPFPFPPLLPFPFPEVEGENEVDGAALVDGEFVVDGANDGDEVVDGADVVDGASDGIKVVEGANDGEFVIVTDGTDVGSSSQNGKSLLLPFPFPPLFLPLLPLPPLPFPNFRKAGLLSAALTIAIEIMHEMQTNRIIDGFLMS